MPFAEIIAEWFVSDEMLTWKLDSLHHVVVTFPVRSIVVSVDFERREPAGPWHVGFQTIAGDPADRTNMGLAFRIFNGVFAAVREFVETRQPDVMLLFAKDEDLSRIYAAYFRKEQAGIEALGYRLSGPERVDPYTQWTLRRAGPADWKDK